MNETTTGAREGNGRPIRASPLAVLLVALRRMAADEAVTLAGNIAFRTLFSAFPFLIFLTALAGFFGNEALAQGVVEYLLSVAPKELVEPLAREIHSILTVPRTGLLSLGALVTIWSAMGGVDSVRVGLNRAYNVRERRPILVIYATGVLFVILAAVMLLVLALLIVFAPVIVAFLDAHAPQLKETTGAFSLLRIPLALLVLFVGLTMSHMFLPAKRLGFLAILPGVLLTVVVWIGLSVAYSIYLVRFATFASMYASLSGVFAALFFLYLSALVLLLGGEVNRVLALRRGERIGSEP